MIKKLIGITALTLIANAGLACPDLTGTYQCEDEDFGKHTRTITQKVVNGITIYTLQTSSDNILEKFIADGESHDVPGGIAAYVATCENNKLLLSVKLDLGELYNGVAKGVMEKKGKNLHIGSTAYIEDELKEVVEVCTGL